MEQMTNEAMVQKKRGKLPLIVAAILTALLAGYLGLCAYARSLDVFFPNTNLNTVDVAGLTVSQAAARLSQELPKKTLAFYLPLANKTGDGVTAPEGETLYADTPAATVSYGELGFTGDLDYTVQTDLALRLRQHEQSFLGSGWDYLAHLLRLEGPAAVQLEPDETIFQDKLAALSEAFYQAPQDASYELTDNAIQITRELKGLRVPAELLETSVLSLFSSFSDALYLEAEILPARTLTAQEIYDQVSGEMKNAGYDAETDTIIPEQVGAEFDVFVAQALLDAADPGKTVSVPAEIQLPTVTAQDLAAVLFRDVLGECRTHVSGTAARISNVKLASAAFDGTVLNAGDVFSYNEATGQRTVAKGYQAAPAYVQGETVDEIGGGVCQPSSTLYYACLLSNLEITERYAHRYIPAYITAGMDATVSWGGPDYKFTNNTDYPIKLVATYSKGYLTVRILGTKTDETTVKMTNEHFSTTPFETVYEDDPTLAPGTETVKTTPYTGHRYKTYRNLYDGDGKLISSTYEATSDYKARNKVILRGPAKAEEPTTPVTGPAEVPVNPEAPQDPVQEPVQEPIQDPSPIVLSPEEPVLPLPVEPDPLWEQ